MSNEATLPLSERIDHFLVKYRNTLLRQRFRPDPFSAVLFSHLVKGGYMEKIETCQYFFRNEDDAVNSWILFSDVTDAYPDDTWKDHEQVFSILSSFDPQYVELLFMAAFVKRDFKLEYESLFEPDNYPKLIEAAVAAAVRADSALGGEFQQPEALTDLMLALADPTPSCNMYNPFAGIASFGVRASSDIKYAGQELNPKVWAIGMIRLAAARSMENTEFTCDDAISNWRPSDKPFDLIIAYPPMGSDRVTKEALTKGTIACDAYFLENAAACLGDTGKAICVIASRLLSSTNQAERNLRKMLVGSDVLDMVVSLPGGVLPSTTLKVVVVVMNKAKAFPGHVRFVNGEPFGNLGRTAGAALDHIGLMKAISENNGITRLVLNSTVEKNDWSLAPKRYFITEQFQGEPLHKFLKHYKGKIVKKGETGRMVRIRDLKSDPLDHELATAQPRVELTSNSRIVDRPVLLIGTRWNALKPTLFDGTGEPILIPADLAAFEYDKEEVDPEYLIQQLLTPSVVEQAGLFRTGFTVPTLRVKDFLSIHVVIPDLADQRKLALEAKLALLSESHEKVMQLRERLGGEKLRQEENSFLRHSIAGPFSNLKFNHNELRDFLMDTIASGRSITLFDRIRPKEKETLADVMNSLDAALELIAIELQRRGRNDLELTSVPLAPLSIHALLEEYIGVSRADAFTFEVEYDPRLMKERSISKLMIDTDRGLFFKLLDNLVANAVAHAFGSKPAKEDRVHVYMTKQEGGPGDFLVLRVSNTGLPFEVAFDKEKFVFMHRKGGNSKGDGYGGYLINTIVERMNGSFELITDPDDRRFATTFHFIFPITG